MIEVQTLPSEEEVGPMEFVPLAPRVYINSFPKSGTHLAPLLVAHLVRMQQPQHWLGSFAGNSMTAIWKPLNMGLPIIRGQPKGTWMIGHLGWKHEYEMAFREMNTCMLFVYRDPRDVAVSLTYHIEDPRDTCLHPAKVGFNKMPSHEDRLRAVIEGIDVFPGVMERWEYYASWLKVGWVLPLSYEQIRTDTRETARKVLDYLIGRELRNNQRQLGMLSLIKQNYIDATDKAIELAGTTEYSASFRKGKVGNWREEFTPELVELFKATDKNGWVERLGYEW